MSLRLPHSMLFCLVPLLASLVACNATRETSQPNEATKPAPVAAARTPAKATITTLSTTENQVLVELPIGTAVGLELGTFLRVYDAADGNVLKGMVQITEILGNNRSIARQIAIGDRLNPLSPGDQVREVLDLAKLIDPKALEQAAKEAVASVDQQSAKENASHTLLREQYQIELTKAQARYDQQLADIRKQYEGQLTATDTVNALVLSRREQELRTDLAALKTTFSEQVAHAVTANRRDSEAKLTATVQENANLSKQIESLLVQQHNQNERIAGLVAEVSERDRTNTKQLRAEIEAREILTAQLSELESRLAGKPTTAIAVLSADPKQGESVLDRLTRLSAALTASEEHNKGLESALSTTKLSLSRAIDAQQMLIVKLAELNDSQTLATTTQNELATTQAKLKQVEQQRAELELARLNAERQLFDLAARVLRLAGSSPETMALQARLRDVLSTDAGLEQSK